jgi:hypothetical protein
MRVRDGTTHHKRLITTRVKGYDITSAKISRSCGNALDIRNELIIVKYLKHIHEFSSLLDNFPSYLHHI